MAGDLNYRDEQSVDRATIELQSILDQVGIGHCSWQDVAEYFHFLFPGQMSFVLNQSLIRPTLNFFAFSGLDENEVQQYFTHYAALNPWIPAWQRRPVGVISRSERDDPIKLKSHTEFYNKWLNKGRGADAAVGVKLGSNNENICFLGVHYAADRGDLFAPALERMLGGVMGHCNRAVKMNQRLAELGEQAISHAALADRSQDIGIVIDRNFKLFEANAASMAAFARPEVVSESSGTVRFRISAAQDWLTRLMDNLDRQKTGQSDKLFFASRDDIWRLTVTPLTSVPKMGSSGLFPLRGLYLVLIRKISNHSFSTKNDALAKYLRLTEREWSLCIELLNGHDLNGAAERLNVSKETVRSRLKQIFAKTDTNRQTELLSLLMRA